MCFLFTETKSIGETIHCLSSSIAACRPLQFAGWQTVTSEVIWQSLNVLVATSMAAVVYWVATWPLVAEWIL
jgi:hypothetical protein